MKTLKELEQIHNTTYSPDEITEGYNRYKKVDVACNKCGAPLYLNESVVVTTYPEMYQYKCMECGNVEYSHLHITPIQYYSDITTTAIPTVINLGSY